MKFEDVENARLNYMNERKKVRRKATRITLSIYLPLLLVVVIVNYSVLANLFLSLFSSSLQNLFFLLIPILMMLFFAILIPYVIIAIVVSSSTADDAVKYKKAYKGYFVGQQLEKTFSNLKYSHDVGLDRQILIDNGMINTGDRYLSNDLTTGKYKDVDFAQADVHIEEEYKDGDGDTQYETVFKGRYLVFEFPKKFNSRMMLTHSGSPKSEINPKDRNKILQYMQTESTEFNKAFAMYAEDGVEALYILTPDFMERVQELGRSHNDTVSIYFADNKMIIGIDDGGDIFEPPSPEKPIDEKIELEKVGQEINLITHIIDSLKLNRKVST